MCCVCVVGGVGDFLSVEVHFAKKARPPFFINSSFVPQPLACCIGLVLSTEGELTPLKKVTSSTQRTMEKT